MFLCDLTKVDLLWKYFLASAQVSRLLGLVAARAVEQHDILQYYMSRKPFDVAILRR